MPLPPSTPWRPLPERPARSVSVVVPAAGDVGRALNAQLDAILEQQSMASFEVVVADNGLSPDARASVDFRTRADARVQRVDATTVRGANHARNEGARLSSGELLVFCDADDELQPGAVEALRLASPRGHLLAGGLDVTQNPRDAQLARGFPDGVVVPDVDRGVCYSALVAVWRGPLESVGGWNESLVGGAEDIDLLARIRRERWVAVDVPAAVVRYTLRTRPKEVFAQLRAYAYETAKWQRRRGEPIPSLRELGRTGGWLMTKGIRDLTRRPTRLRWFGVAGRFVGDASGRVARLR